MAKIDIKVLDAIRLIQTKKKEATVEIRVLGTRKSGRSFIAKKIQSLFEQEGYTVDLDDEF